MIRATLVRFAVGSLPLLFGSAAAVAQDGEKDSNAAGLFDRTPRSCVSVTAIDRTEAVDDQNILFYMRGKAVYRNTLPQKCPRLEQENRFGYKITVGRLCNNDVVTVLEQTAFGLQTGFTCRLGDFVPMSPEEIELLENEDDRPGAARVEAEPVDLKQEAGAADESEPAEADEASKPNE
jgi:hypothetical protein